MERNIKKILKNKIVLGVLSIAVVFLSVYYLVLPTFAVDEQTAYEDPAISNDSLSPDIINELETVADPFEIEQEREEALNNSVDETDTSDSEKDLLYFVDETTPIKVYIEAPKEAFPEGTSISVGAIGSEEILDAFYNVLDQSTVKRTEAVNISFHDVNGNKIEPTCLTKVSLASDLIRNSRDTVIVLISDEGEGKIIERSNEEAEEDGFTFESDYFSTFIIAEKENEEETFAAKDENEPDEISYHSVFDFEGDGYRIHIDAPSEASIPEGTQLAVKEIDPNSDEYLKLLGEAWSKINAEFFIREQIINQLNRDYVDPDLSLIPEEVPLKNIDGVRFFDISFIYEGKEIEPCASVKVQIELNEGIQQNDHSGTEIVHFGTSGTEIIEGVDARIDKNELLVGVAYSQESFSPIGILSTSDVQDSETDFQDENDGDDSSFAEFVSSFSPFRLFSALKPVRVYADDSYTITKKETNGTVKFYSDAACTNEITSASPNTTVYIKVTPNEGYYFSSTTVTDVDANPDTRVMVEKVVGQSNIYSFKMPDFNVLVTGVFQLPPQADKKLTSNGDGTYTLNLSVKGSTADISAAADTTKKVNVIIVMDRSSSMTSNRTTIYAEYTESTYPSSDGPYYGLVDGEYVTLNRNNDSWTYQKAVYTEYTGDRYVVSNDTNGNKYVVTNNGSLIEVTYVRRNSTNYHWFEANSQSETRYDNYTRYIVDNSQTSDVWGFVSGSMTSLTYSDNKYYYSNSTVAQPYSGKIYTTKSVTRLVAEQNALDSMVTTLLEYNNPDIAALKDVVEIEILSFAMYRGDSSDMGFTGTETGLSYNYSTIMAAVNQDDVAQGTNWEDALKYAKEEADKIHAAQPTEDVYILFLTDGEPTAWETETHHFDYSASGQVSALQNAEDDAKDIIDATYKYPADYLDPDLAGKDTRKKNHLYGVFTYGTGENFLKRLVNYAYNNGDIVDTTTELGKFFFDAKDNESLMNAMDSFIAAVFSSLSYANVSITDGVTIGGVNSVTSSTLVSGTAGGFEYTVKGPNLGVLYTVTATGDSSNPTVTFHVNGQPYPGLKKSTAIHIMGDDPNTEAIETEYDQTLTYWYFDEEHYPNYKMCLATVDKNGLVQWDLSGVGALQNNWTYNCGFVVWPNQDAYDYVAGLNNGIDGYTWNTQTQEDSGKGYYTNGTKYEYLVRYPKSSTSSPSDIEGSTYAVLTNYEQSMSYNILSEVTTNGVTQYTYGEPAVVEMATADPMGLTGSDFTVTKNWNDALDTSHLLELIKKAEELEKVYGITLNLYEDNKLYKSYTFEPVYNSETDEYEWPSQDISIAPALLVSELPEGTKEDTYKSVIYNNKTYYVLNEGHEYRIEETNTDFHFEFHADPYHPALIDSVMTNVSFVIGEDGHIVNGSTVTRVGDVPLVTFAANNSLTAELDITKWIVDTNDVLTDAQEDAETFTYKVTLTVPYDPEEPDKYIKNIYAYEWVPRTNTTTPDGTTRFYVHGYQEDDLPLNQGFEQDVERFNKKIFGRYTVSYPDSAGTENYTLSDMFTPDQEGAGTQTGSIYITLKRNEILRFTNLPSGTQYIIQEIYANKRQADPSRDADAKPGTNDPASNIASVGYSVSVSTKNGNPTVSSTATANDTVSGTITDLDTRYYNRFTNTLSDAVAVNLAANKHLENYEWSGERYYIKMTTDSNNSTLDRFTVSQKQMYLSLASGTADRSYDFGNSLRFSEAGVYNYYFDEMSGKQDTSTNEYIGDPLSGKTANGIIYDEQKKLTITIEKVNGRLRIGEIKDGNGNIIYSSDPEATVTTGYVSYDQEKDLITTTITNRMLKVLVYKIGSSDTENALSGVQFKLYSDPNCSELVTRDARGQAIGAVNIIYYEDEEKTIQTEEETEYYDEELTGILTTDSDGFAEIGTLVTGKYYLKEIETADYYVVLEDPIEITVAENGTISYKQNDYVQSVKYNSSHTPVSDLVKEKGSLFIVRNDDTGSIDGYALTVNNNSGSALPYVGGPGTSRYLVLGSVLIAGSVLYEISYKRNKKAKQK